MLEFGVEWLVAQAEGKPTFNHICGKHGPAVFWTTTGECVDCQSERLHNLSPADFTARGTIRKVRHDPNRIAARREGRLEYDADCAKHSRTAFHTLTGKCLSCFTANGSPRRGKVVNVARAAARREGERTYLADCAVHGTTAHSVTHGRCLSCFNTAGARRPV